VGYRTEWLVWVGGRRGAQAIALALAALAWPCAPAQELAPEVLLLSRVKAHLREAFAHLPNYTCLQTLERSHKPLGEEPLKRMDTVSLEVLYSGGSELYALPGDRGFQESKTPAFVGDGLISTGVFALHLKAALLNGNALLTWRGEEELDGRRAARWDFLLSPSVSGLVIRVPEGHGTAGMKGSVWVDPKSLDVLRLEDHAYEIPIHLPVKDASTIVNYARTRVGDEDVTLPQEGVIRVLGTTGEEDRNTFAFTHCRAFGTQSTLKFDGIAADGNAPPVTAKSAELSKLLPAGLEIPIALTAPVTESAAVGDLIEGKIASDIAQNRKILIPQGSIARGRIRRLEHHAETDHYFAVGLEVTEIETSSERFQFYADLLRADRIPGFEWAFTSKSTKMETKTLSTTVSGGGPRTARVIVTQGESLKIPDVPGVGSFFVRGDRFLLPAGFKMVWKTRSPAE
jgi:hypothetical protein